MTLDEAVVLARNGDEDAIILLGKYYMGDGGDIRDIHEALKWFTIGG